MAIACSSVQGENIGTSADPIIKGKDSTSDQDAVVLIVKLDFKSGIGACTGTLIAPNLVLTARHCVSNVASAPFGCKEDGTLYPGSQGGKAGSDFDPKILRFFVGKDAPEFGRGPINVAANGKAILHDGSKVLCSHDLALVVLDRDIPDAKIASLRLEGDPRVGEKLTSVGWGVTEKEDIPAVRKQRTDVLVRRVGPSPLNEQKLEAPVPGNDFEVGESICSGDSGGPAFSQETGSVIGVVSRGGNGSSSEDPRANCTGSSTRNNYTKVAPFKDLIMKAFAEAGKDPWVEGGPDPRKKKNGEECSEDAECRYDFCRNGSCADTCSDEQPCPEGYQCGLVDDKNICRSQAEVDDEKKKIEEAEGCSVSGPVGTESGGALRMIAMGGTMGLLVWTRTRGRRKTSANRK